MNEFTSIISTEKDFEDYLHIEIAKGANVVDDSLPEYVENKMEELGIEELMEYAQAWGNKLYQRGKIEGAREFVSSLTK